MGRRASADVPAACNKLARNWTRRRRLRQRCLDLALGQRLMHAMCYISRTKQCKSSNSSQIQCKGMVAESAKKEPSTAAFARAFTSLSVPPAAALAAARTWPGGAAAAILRPAEARRVVSRRNGRAATAGMPQQEQTIADQRQCACWRRWMTGPPLPLPRRPAQRRQTPTKHCIEAWLVWDHRKPDVLFQPKSSHHRLWPAWLFNDCALQTDEPAILPTQPCGTSTGSHLTTVMVRTTYGGINGQRIIQQNVKAACAGAIGGALGMKQAGRPRWALARLSGHLSKCALAHFNYSYTWPCNPGRRAAMCARLCRPLPSCLGSTIPSARMAAHWSA